MDTSGKSLVDHWNWSVKKGLMNQNTASALRAACSQVLSILDDWESQDVSKMDIDETLRRFENLKKKEFKPQTLETYKRRFRTAVSSYLTFLENPSGWKPTMQERAEKPERNGSNKQQAENGREENPDPSGKLVDYPYPLREGMIVRLRLPRDLNAAEVKRLTRFMQSLAIDFADSAE